MITQRIGSLRLEIYSGIDELTAERFHKFNLFCLIQSGIGSDVASVQNHITTIYQALNRKDLDRLRVLFENYYHSLNLILEQMDVQTMAFVCLVHSINGKIITDLSDENLKRVSTMLTQAQRRSVVLNLLNEIKKKLKRKSKSISPIELARLKQDHIINSLSGIMKPSSVGSPGKIPAQQ